MLSEENVKSWYPIYHRPGYQVVREWVEPFDDGAGHKATVCWVEYKNKKGDLFTAQKWVRWDEEQSRPKTA